MNSDDFFDDAGTARAEVHAGRYRLPHPETGVEQSWTRATTHAELLEDSHGLTRWSLRQLVRGLRRRPDLLRLIEGWADEPADADIDPVIETAHEVAGNDAKANLGTAVHGALQRVDRAWNARGTEPKDDAWFLEIGVPEWALPHARGYVAELARHGLTPISSMTERRVVNTDLGCAGTLDNLYAEADGSVALGDKKTGRLDYPERKFAIQLAVYLGASHMLDPDGGPPVDLRSIGLRREYAVLVHVDVDSGACSAYRVDMRRGQLGANLASDVRAWRRERHLLLPYVRPGAPAPVEGRHLAVVRADSDPGASFTNAAVVADFTDHVTGHRSAAAPTPDPFGGMDSQGVAATDLAVDREESKTRLSEAELSRLTKAQVQQYGRERGVTDLAHNKPQLFQIYAAAGILAGGGSTKVHDQVKLIGTDQHGNFRTADKDPQAIPPGPVTAGGEDPTDWHSPAWHRARMAEISAADSAATLGRIHAYVTRLGGDQAWTDQMTEASRQRLAALDAAQARKIEWAGIPHLPMDAVKLAKSSQDMAQVWSLVTLGGSDEAAWTPELNEAAHARLAALEAEREQPKPPSTPFG